MSAPQTNNENSVCLELIDGSSRRMLALNHFPFTIGRAPECDLVLSQPYISRRHAQITREGMQFLLSDVGSRYGTFINGTLTGRRLLRPHDTLHFASTEGPQLRFVIPEPHESGQHDVLAQLQELSVASSDLEKLRWFLEAARELNDADKIDQVLSSLLEATLILAQVERGFVFLSREGGLELALGMDADGKVLKDSSTVSQTVLRQAAEGADQFIITDTLSAEKGPLPASIIAQSIRRVICIPLHAGHRTAEDAANRSLLGVLYLDSRFQPDHFSDIDHELLKTIAREAAALVENAQLASIEEDARQYKKELKIAAGIQQGLMAMPIATVPFASVEAHSTPCSAVGGDFFDVIPGSDTLSLVLVDVSGKGISAAILAATLQGMLYVQLQAGDPLEDIAAAVNDYLCTKNVGKYATMLLLRLHQDGLLEYINCGHIHPRLCTEDGVARLSETNLPVGLLREATYNAASCGLKPGWHLTLVSDGFTEAENLEGDSFGDERLDRVAECFSLQSMMSCLEDFCATNPAADDCTVLHATFHGL
jgi:phosphoserine phosphatase RsbU/P